MTTMVFTAAQTTNFFTEATQMGLTTRTKDQLNSEGINTIDDLADFDNDKIWKQVISNCKYPPKLANAHGVLQEQAAFHLPAKSLHRLKVATQAVKYYLETGRPITLSMMNWTNTLRSFEMQWKALKNLKAHNDTLLVPRITKSLDVFKWLEA